MAAASAGRAGQARLTMERATALSVLMAFGLAGQAQSADLPGLLDKLNPVLSEVLTIRTVAQLCAEREQQHADRIDAALQSWEKANELRVFDALTGGLAALDEGIDRQLQDGKIAARDQIAPQLDGNPQECDVFNDMDGEPGELRDAIRDLLLDAHALDISPRPGPIPDNVDVSPISGFSIRAGEIMAMVTPENATDDDLDDAQEAFLEYYLDAWGYVAIYGRIDEGEGVREWRGDYQSRYVIECAGFASVEQSERFSAATGRDMIIIGEPRFAYVHGQNGTIRLNDCLVFDLEADVDLDEVDAGAPGFMLRPLDMAEAFAGPMAGPRPHEIDRVIYDASFSTRIDGFGNGYVDRQEAIYVLLRDGRAFLHDWGFPITDIDLGALERREPEKLFTWRDDWGVAVLRPTEGEEIRLEDGVRLVPIGEGSRLGDEYYYLQVSMGGVRRDRAFDFAPDGSLAYSRGGFVAGNFGTSYIIAAGGQDDEGKGRYRFEDYALIVTSTQGEERRFFAVGEDEDRDQPQEVIIDGEVYWLRD